jgi:hypothetical protein
MSKFYELKKGAEEAQQRKARDENDAIAMATNYFLKSGIDYKGQFQCCYDAKGGGGEVEVSVDPAAFFNPLVHTKLTLTANTSLSKERMIVTQRGPSEVGIYTVPMPIMINCLVGWDVTASIKGELEVSVGASFSLGPASNIKDAVTESRKSFHEHQFGEFACDFENAGLSFEAEAKVGAKVGGGYNYEHFFAIDCAPIPFSSNDKAKVRKVLGEVWHSGSYKEALKNEVKEFLNSRPNLWQKPGEGLAHYGKFHRDSSKLFSEYLNRIINNPTLENFVYSGSSAQRAAAYLDNLKVWATKNNQPNISTFLAISAHQAEGEAGLFAKAGVSANATFVNVGVEAEVKGPTVSGSYKHANVRYQVVYPATFDEPDKTTGEMKTKETKIVMTQETRIVYKTFDLTAFAATVNAQAGVIGLGEIEAEAGVSVGTRDGFSAKAGMKARGGILRGGVEKEKEKSKGGGHFFSNLNRLTYETTTIFWSDDNCTESLQGTGYSVGGSFLIKNMIALWKDINDHHHMDKLSKGSLRYIHNIAQSLKISSQNVFDFFVQLTEDNIEFYFKNTEKLGCEAMLLEASFKVPYLEININPKSDITDDDSKSDREVIVLDPKVFKDILELPFGKEKQLESIKLRYRIQDTHDYSTNLFKLGANATGVGGSIALKKIHKAGSEGIVDLLSVWIGGKVVADSKESAEMYEKAVPPVVLFCQ